MAALAQAELEAMSTAMIDKIVADVAPDTPDAVQVVMRRRLEKYASVGANVFAPRTTPVDLVTACGAYGLMAPWMNPSAHVLDGSE